MVAVAPLKDIIVTVSKAKKDKIFSNIIIKPNISAPQEANTVVASLEVVIDEDEKIYFDLESINEVQKTGLIGRFFSFLFNSFISLFSIIFS